MATSSDSVTQLLLRWRQGDQAALGELMPVVYNEMHNLAHRYMQGERSGHSLQTTALVHEAYLRLIDYKDINWQNRNHFMAVAAVAMRRVLIDHARAFLASKRWRHLDRVDFDELTLLPDDSSPEKRAAVLISVHEALERLEQINERECRVVELRYFLELSAKEAADVLGVSESTVNRDWEAAKAWLLRELTREEPAERIQPASQIT